MSYNIALLVLAAVVTSCGYEERVKKVGKRKMRFLEASYPSDRILEDEWRSMKIVMNYDQITTLSADHQGYLKIVFDQAAKYFGDLLKV